MIALRSSETSSTAVHHRWAMTLVVGTVGGAVTIAMPLDFPMGPRSKGIFTGSMDGLIFSMVNVATVNKPYMDP